MPRTGTTLLRSLLNCSADVAISLGESHFFGGPRFFGLLTRRGYRQRVAAIGDRATDEGAARIADYVYAHPHLNPNFWGPLLNSLSRDEFLARLLASDERERALFELALSCGARGRAIGGEKTPAHIYAVPTLLHWFPAGKIIHTLRDPRAVYVSNRRKYERRGLPRPVGLVYELYRSLETIYEWRRVTRLHRRYQQRYPDRYYLSKYEDLIADPVSHLQRLCDFVGVAFTEEMLRQTFTNSSFLPRNQLQGFDTAALDRWRQHLPPALNRWFTLWCRKSLLEFGYKL